MQDVKVKSNTGLSWQIGFQHEEHSFHQLLGLTFKEEKKWYILSLALLGRFGQDIRNTLKILNCGGEGWRR
jgi:hypothetical protein